MNDNHPLMVFAKECVLGAYSEAELADAARRAINYALEANDEPVAWREFDGEGGYYFRTYEYNEDYAAKWDVNNPNHKGWVEPLYTHPPQRKPLTDEEIDAIVVDEVGLDADADEMHNFARAIEAAHGIKEKNE